MRSQLFQILERNRDPETVLSEIADKIVGSERCYPVSQAVRDRFNKSTGDGRSWGMLDGSIEDIKLQREALDPGFHVTFVHESYARGCYMGSSNFRMFIPDELVVAYEDFKDLEDGYREYRDDEQHDTAANKLDEILERLVKERVQSMTSDIADEARQEEADRVAQANATYELLGSWHNAQTEAKYKALVAKHEAGNLTNNDLDDFLNELLDNAPGDVVIGYARRILTVDNLRFEPAKSTAWARIQRQMLELLAG